MSNPEAYDVEVKTFQSVKNEPFSNADLCFVYGLDDAWIDLQKECSQRLESGHLAKLILSKSNAAKITGKQLIVVLLTKK